MTAAADAPPAACHPAAVAEHMVDMWSGMEHDVAKHVVAAPGVPQENARYHGFGAVTYANTNKYVGTMEHGRLHGQGTFAWKDHVVYSGDFTANAIVGHGGYDWPDGGRYRGEVRDGLRHGRGVYIKGGVRYEGEWAAGKKEGIGCLHLNASGSHYYEGEFVAGRKHGWGRMVFPSGSAYEGQWCDGKMSGYGIMQWVLPGRPGAAQTALSAVAKSVARPGSAAATSPVATPLTPMSTTQFDTTLPLPGADCATGKESSARQSFGSAAAPDTPGTAAGSASGAGSAPVPMAPVGPDAQTGRMERYEGEWENGKPHGWGTYTWLTKARPKTAAGVAESGAAGGELVSLTIGSSLAAIETPLYGENVYKGWFSEGQRHGKGLLLLADGTVFEGRWVHNVKEGHGLLTHPDGTVELLVLQRNAIQSKQTLLAPQAPAQTPKSGVRGSRDRGEHGSRQTPSTATGGGGGGGGGGGLALNEITLGDAVGAGIHDVLDCPDAAKAREFADVRNLLLRHLPQLKVLYRFYAATGRGCSGPTPSDQLRERVVIEKENALLQKKLTARHADAALATIAEATAAAQERVEVAAAAACVSADFLKRRDVTERPPAHRYATRREGVLCQLHDVVGRVTQEAVVAANAAAAAGVTRIPGAVDAQEAGESSVEHTPRAVTGIRRTSASGGRVTVVPSFAPHDIECAAAGARSAPHSARGSTASEHVSSGQSFSVARRASYTRPSTAATQMSANEPTPGPTPTCAGYQGASASVTGDTPRGNDNDHAGALPPSDTYVPLKSIASSYRLQRAHAAAVREEAPTILRLQQLWAMLRDTGIADVDLPLWRCNRYMVDVIAKQPQHDDEWINLLQMMDDEDAKGASPPPTPARGSAGGATDGASVVGGAPTAVDAQSTMTGVTTMSRRRSAASLAARGSRAASKTAAAEQKKVGSLALPPTAGQAAAAESVNAAGEPHGLAAPSVAGRSTSDIASVKGGPARTEKSARTGRSSSKSHVAAVPAVKTEQVSSKSMVATTAKYQELDPDDPRKAVWFSTFLACLVKLAHVKLKHGSRYSYQNAVRRLTLSDRLNWVLGTCVKPVLDAIGVLGASPVGAGFGVPRMPPAAAANTTYKVPTVAKKDNAAAATLGMQAVGYIALAAKRGEKGLAESSTNTMLPPAAMDATSAFAAAALGLAKPLPSRASSERGGDGLNETCKTLPQSDADGGGDAKKTSRTAWGDEPGAAANAPAQQGTPTLSSAKFKPKTPESDPAPTAVSDDSGEDIASNVDLQSTMGGTRRLLSTIGGSKGRKAGKSMRQPKREVTFSTKEFTQKCVANPKLTSKVAATTVVEAVRSGGQPAVSVAVYHEVCEVPASSTALPACYDCLCVGIARQSALARDGDWEAKYALAAAQRDAAQAVVDAFETDNVYVPPATPPPKILPSPYCAPHDAVAPPAAMPVAAAVPGQPDIRSLLTPAEAGEPVTRAQAVAARRTLRDVPEAPVKNAPVGLVRAVLRSRPVCEALASGAPVLVDYFNKYQVKMRVDGVGGACGAATPAGVGTSYALTLQQFVEVLQDVGLLPSAPPSQLAVNVPRENHQKVSQALAGKLLARFALEEAEEAAAEQAAAANTKAAKGGKDAKKATAAAGKNGGAGVDDTPVPPPPAQIHGMTKAFLQRVVAVGGDARAPSTDGRASPALSGGRRASTPALDKDAPPFEGSGRSTRSGRSEEAAVGGTRRLSAASGRRGSAPTAPAGPTFAVVTDLPAGGVGSVLRMCLWYAHGVDPDAWYKVYSREEARLLQLKAEQEDAKRYEQLLATAHALALNAAGNPALGGTANDRDKDAGVAPELRAELMARDDIRVQAAWFPAYPATVATMSDAWVPSAVGLPLVYYEFVDMLVLAACVLLGETNSSRGSNNGSSSSSSIHDNAPAKVLHLLDMMRRHRDTLAWGSRQRVGSYRWDGR